MQRHRFLVLYYCKLHNENIEKGDVSYLNGASVNAKKRRFKKGSYHCTRQDNRKAKKTKLTMKKRTQAKKIKRTMKKAMKVKKSRRVMKHTMKAM